MDWVMILIQNIINDCIRKDGALTEVKINLEKLSLLADSFTNLLSNQPLITDQSLSETPTDLSLVESLTFRTFRTIYV